MGSSISTSKSGAVALKLSLAMGETILVEIAADLGNSSSKL